MVVTRRELLAAGAAGFAGLLTGCGSGPDGPITSASFGSGSGYDGPPVDLAFWNGFTGGDGPTMLSMIDEFTKRTPKVKISMVTVRWQDFYTKAPAAVRSGKGPDVAIMHVDQLATNVAHGIVLPLDDLARDLGLREQDFAPAVWKAGIYQGHRYGIPLDMHPLGLYQNDAVLTKAGLDPKQPPKNRDEYEAALEELKAKGVQGSWVSPFLFTGGFQFQSLLWQFGGELTSEDATKATWNSDAGVEALTWMKSLMDRGYSPRNVGQDADSIAFKNAQNAYIWNGAWAIGDYGATEGLKWSLAPLPQIGSEPAAWSNSHQFVVLRQRDRDPNRLQAAKAFINSVTQSPVWATAGMIPARSVAREQPEFKKLIPQRSLAEEIPFVRFAAGIPGLSDVRESTLDLGVAKALTGGATVRAALDASAEEADSLLQSNVEAFQA